MMRRPPIKQFKIQIGLESKLWLIGKENNCTAMLELNKSLGSAYIIPFAELARVKKPVCIAG